MKFTLETDKEGNIKFEYLTKDVSIINTAKTNLLDDEVGLDASIFDILKSIRECSYEYKETKCSAYK